jgi:hypothetical protein
LSTGVGVSVDGKHVHEDEPTELALKLSLAHQDGHQPAEGQGLCGECGIRLTWAIKEWANWVVRRVEKVRFRDDRSVNRQSSVDFVVRDDAPVFKAGDGREFWLVPVSIMRRKTLVNFDLRDEAHDSLPLPGLRLTQYLDESILRAAALSDLEALQPPDPGANPPIPVPSLTTKTAEFIHRVIAGEVGAVRDCIKVYDQGGDTEQISELKKNPGLFDALFRRLSYHFVLYSFVEIGEDRRRHRIIHMSIDEPLTFCYRHPGLPWPAEGADQLGGTPPDVVSYRRGDPVRWRNPDRLGEALGYLPTRIRFPVPAAENAASFHFEVEAPPGVDIVEASMLAGRPQLQPKTDEAAGQVLSEKEKAERRVSFDRVKLCLPTIGLHVAAVPDGSSSRAQIYLQVAVRGWYATMVVSCWVTFALLAAIWANLGASRRLSTSDLVALLASVVAAVATLITQHEFDGVAGRLLGLPRILAGVEALLLVIAASVILFVAPYKGTGHWPWPVPIVAGVLCIAGGLISLSITLSWVLAYRRQGQAAVTSPWEMGSESELGTPPEPPKDFWEGASRFEYTRPAVRVDSAEAWHYQWSRGLDQRTRTSSRPSPPAPDPARWQQLRDRASLLRDRLPGAHNGEHGRGRSAVRGSDRR